MTLPNTEDMTKAREQAAHALGEAAEQARTPLLAALGATDLAARALVDALQKLREQADSARADWAGDPVELRKRIDAYAESAVRFYGYLAERGEEALERIREQPEVRTVTERAGEAAEDVRDLADDVLGKVSRPQGETADENGAERGRADEPESTTTSGNGSGSAKSSAAKSGTAKSSGAKSKSTSGKQSASRSK